MRDLNSFPTPPILGSFRAPGPQGQGKGVWRSTLATLALLFALLLSLTTPAFAVDPSERLADPALEARARGLSSTLRCLVCQNESIDDSGASLAHDIRMLVRERLLAGDTDAQARQAIVNRYGDFVLLKPPVMLATYALWFGPPMFLLVGFACTVLWLRRRSTGAVGPAPLTAQEKRHLDGLLRETDR